MAVVDFQPSATANPPFQFQATLDGAQYTVSVTWNLFGNRWYVTIRDVSGNLILMRPMVGSGAKIQAVLTWANGTATAALASAHNIPVGSVANVEVTDTGLTYDGFWRALATDALTLTFQLPTDPTQYGVTGNVSQDVNLIGGQPSSYDSNGNPATFFSSTLIYRSSSQQFEVSP
jgi:hypothetical protein